MWSLTEGKDVLPGRVRLELPRLAENGHSVAMSVSVENPMTPADQELGSLERRIRSCFYGLHAEPPPYGSALLLELEAYLAWRGRGLPIEAPAVRR